MIANKSYLADFGNFFHEAFLALAQSASGRELPYRRRFARREADFPKIRFYRHSDVPISYWRLREASNQVCFRGNSGSEGA
jgi:hypothetical protein